MENEFKKCVTISGMENDQEISFTVGYTDKQKDRLECIILREVYIGQINRDKESLGFRSLKETCTPKASKEGLFLPFSHFLDNLVNSEELRRITAETKKGRGGYIYVIPEASFDITERELCSNLLIFDEDVKKRKALSERVFEDERTFAKVMNIAKIY